MEGRFRPPKTPPPHQALPAAPHTTPFTPPRSFSSSRTPRCSRASSWRSIVSISPWMSSSGMYWSAWTCPTTPRSPEERPISPTCPLPGVLPFFGPALACPFPHPSTARCRTPVRGRATVESTPTPPGPWPQPRKAHPEGGSTFCLLWHPLPLLCHSINDITGEHSNLFNSKCIM